MTETKNLIILSDIRFNSDTTSKKATIANLDLWLFEVMKTQKNLTSRLESLEKDNKNLKHELDKLTTINSEKDDEIQTLSSKIREDSWSKVVKRGNVRSEEQLNLLIATSNESKEQIQRENNIIVFGVQESLEVSEDKIREDDEKSIKEILSKVDIDMSKVKKIIRFKKKNKINNKPCPILLITNSNKDRNLILKSTNKIINENTEKVYFNADLTEAQRVEQKTLRDEMKKKNETNKNNLIYFSINKGKVVEKNKSNK
jgi:hypothetical protein